MSIFRLLGAVALAVSAVILFGAKAPAQGGKKTNEVAGKVTFAGEPVAKGKIAFHPEKGKGPATATIADGTYSLKDIRTGSYKVTIEGEKIPKDFAYTKTTPLTVEVKPGANALDFDITK